MTTEQKRLVEAHEKHVPWRKWGPYLSDRQWGTVREDYSQNGDAWNYFTHDQARSRAYRWGEDGIAGFSDDCSKLCFAPAFWNGRDPILKERFFGLTNAEGNHGEDVKEYYFYLDSTPTHSYMKMLYKYPQAAFPYSDLVKTNGSRNRNEMEYELLDTGVFDDDRYFDISVEYAKAAPEDILIQIKVTNRGPDPATLHVLPHLWFRNTWWENEDVARPILHAAGAARGVRTIIAQHQDLGARYLYCEHAAQLLFTNNETNLERIFGIQNRTPYVKDGINDYIVQGRKWAVNPQQRGTKSAAWYELKIEGHGTQVIRMRMTETAPSGHESMFDDFDDIFLTRQQEADEFYASITPESLDADARRVMRQGFGGMLWSKQTYIYEVNRWLKDHGSGNGSDGAVPIRNSRWFHMMNCDIISMPDKWEYPWFAAWDLAFHTVALSFVDSDFARQQLELMLQGRYLHPNGQIPAYEWNFSDVNPPVHAWAALFNSRLSPEASEEKAIENLKTYFHKLLLNFTWWVNRKDRDGRNVFEGGFLGLDNIGVFDRSAPLPTGGCLEQADGTAWMGLFSQNMLDIALQLATKDPSYEDLAVKFYEHFIWIASAMNSMGRSNDSMWDEEDGFFYDVLRLPDGSARRLKVRSMVGLLPLCAVTVYSPNTVIVLSEFRARVAWFNQHRPDLLAGLHPPGRQGLRGSHMLSLLNDDRLRRVLARMLDPNEFLSDYGIRSLSRFHLKHPYVFSVGNQEYRVDYLPAESNTGLFGGNSNWRGPIWMPVNALIIRALIQMYSYYGDSFKVECPTGSANYMTLFQVAQEIVKRLSNIFLRDRDGRRAVYGGAKKFQEDPHWRDNVLFYEYFHGDNGAGLGASHQTGWTGLVSGLMSLFGTIQEEAIREHGLKAVANMLRREESQRREEPLTAGSEQIVRITRSTAAPDYKKPRSKRLREE
jgi:hypothetical protein